MSEKAQPAPRRKLHWSRGLLFSVGVLIFSLAAVEVILRFTRRDPADVSSSTGRVHDYFYFDDNGCFHIRPNVAGLCKPYDKDGDEVRVRINNIGIRGETLRDDPDRRIAFLGDSITFNGGVPLHRTFIHLVEQQMNAASPGLDVECLNFGASDTGIRQYALKLEHHALNVKPDAIVVCLYLNDSRPPQGFVGEDGRTRLDDAIERSPLNRLLLVRMAHDAIKTRRVLNNPALQTRFDWFDRYRRGAFVRDRADWNMLIHEARFDWGAAWTDQSTQTLEKGLLRIMRLCRQRSVRLYAVYFPVTPQIFLDQPWPEADHPQRALADMTSRLGVPMLDILPVLRDARDRGHLSMDQCHLTTLGNQVAADAIAPWLLELERQANERPGE